MQSNLASCTLVPFTPCPTVHIPASIYAGQPHTVADEALLVPKSIRTELECFMDNFRRHSGSSDSHYRLDCVVGEHGLWVIEINPECREGWGIAANLARAAGRPLATEAFDAFPQQFFCESHAYDAEFRLARTEAETAGSRRYSGVESLYSTEGYTPSVYDNKRYLRDFWFTEWRAREQRVRVPEFLVMHETGCASAPAQPSIPYDHVVWKFCEKHGPDAQRAKCSVAPAQVVGKGKHVRDAFARGEAVAQRIIPIPTSRTGMRYQAIVLCAGTTPVTGYIQLAPHNKFVVNDKDTYKGPLVFL